MADLAEVAANKPANSDFATIAPGRVRRRRSCGCSETRRCPTSSSSRAARSRSRMRSSAPSTGSHVRTRQRALARAGDACAALPARLPRQERLHALADEHGPGQGRPLPEVRLASDLVARRPISARGASGPRWRRPRRRRSPKRRRRSRRYPHDIACLIAEPIQCEGGDRHLRSEFLLAAATVVPPPRCAPRSRRGADRRRHDRYAVVLPAARPRSRRRRVRQEGPARGNHGGAPGARGRRQRVSLSRSDQLDLGRQPHRHGSLAPPAPARRADGRDRQCGKRRAPLARTAGGRSRPTSLRLHPTPADVASRCHRPGDAPT